MVAEVDVDVVEVVVVSMIAAATTTCVATTRTADEEATTTEEAGEDTMATRAVMEDSRTSRRLSRTHGRRHQVEQISSLPHHRAGFRLQVSQASLRMAAAMERRLLHHQRNVQHGWAQRLHSTAGLPQTRPAATTR
jgi:hypothetical protein